MCAPRARACSSSSSTKNHAPSAITKPSRSRENGREARSGSWFQRVLMMRMSWKPRRISGAMGESTPPAIMVFSTPRLDVPEGVAQGVGGRSAAGGDDVAQPAESEPHGNFAGQRADGAGGNGVHAALLQVAGVVEAVLLFGEILAAAARAHHHADLPQFVARHGVRRRARHPPALRPRWPRPAARRAKRAGGPSPPRTCFSSNSSGTSPATCTTKPDGSKRVMRRTPLTPFRVASQKHSRPIPFGLTAPIPVITTRRMVLALPLPQPSV